MMFHCLVLPYFRPRVPDFDQCCQTGVVLEGVAYTEEGRDVQKGAWQQPQTTLDRSCRLVRMTSLCTQKSLESVDDQDSDHSSFISISLDDDEDVAEGKEKIRSSPASTLSASATPAAPTPTSSRPALSLAHRMREIRQDVQKKISRLRSRSAERISQRSVVAMRGAESGGKGEDGAGAGSGDVGGNHRRTHHLPTSVSSVNLGGSAAAARTEDNRSNSYTGPFIGKARAIVDNTPSPYDRDALRFKRGDLIDLISKNPSGLWKGKCQTGRVGTFKFITVEVLPERTSRRGRNRRRSFNGSDLGGVATTRGGQQKREVQSRPKTVGELLKRLSLEEYTSVFVLNGYEDLESFQDMDEDELDYLGIRDETHRTKLLTAVELLQDYASLHSGEESGQEDAGCGSLPSSSSANEPEPASRHSHPAAAGTQPSSSSSMQSPFRRLSFPRDSGCYASNENLQPPQPRSSPAASDRSSHSGLSSHPESGIHADIGGLAAAGAAQSGSSCDEDGGGGGYNSSASRRAVVVRQRSAEQAAKTRTLRDRHTAHVELLEEDAVAAVVTTPTEKDKPHLTHAQTMDMIRAARHDDLDEVDATTTTTSPSNATSSNRLSDAKAATSPSPKVPEDRYEALVKKYTANKEPVKSGAVAESKFFSARNLFEQGAASNGCANGRRASGPPSPQKVKPQSKLKPLVATSVD